MIFKRIQKKFLKKGKALKAKKTLKDLFIQAKKEKQTLDFINYVCGFAKTNLVFFKQKKNKTSVLSPLFSNQQKKSFLNFIKKSKNHKKSFFIFFTIWNIKNFN